MIGKTGIRCALVSLTFSSCAEGVPAHGSECPPAFLTKLTGGELKQAITERSITIIGANNPVHGPEVFQANGVYRSSSDIYQVVGTYRISFDEIIITIGSGSMAYSLYTNTIGHTYRSLNNGLCPKKVARVQID